FDPIRFDQFSIGCFDALVGLERLLVEATVFERERQLLNKSPQKSLILCAVFPSGATGAESHDASHLALIHQRHEQLRLPAIEYAQNSIAAFLRRGVTADLRTR